MFWVTNEKEKAVSQNGSLLGYNLRKSFQFNFFHHTKNRRLCFLRHKYNLFLNNKFSIVKILKIKKDYPFVCETSLKTIFIRKYSKTAIYICIIYWTIKISDINIKTKCLSKTCLSKLRFVISAWQNGSRSIPYVIEHPRNIKGRSIYISFRSIETVRIECLPKSSYRYKIWVNVEEEFWKNWSYRWKW